MTTSQPEWQFTYDDISVREGEMTLAEMIEVEEKLKVDWPSPLKSARHAHAFASVLLTRRTGRPAAEVLVKVNGITGDALLESFTIADFTEAEGE